MFTCEVARGVAWDFVFPSVTYSCQKQKRCFVSSIVVAYYFLKESIVFSPVHSAVCSSGTLAGINILIKAYECINYTWEVSKAYSK